MPVRVKVNLDTRAVSKMQQGLAKTPKTLLDAAYHVNAEWAKHLKHKLATAFIDLFAHKTGSTEVEVAYHNYKDSEGSMQEYAIGDLAGAHGVNFGNIHPEGLQEYTRHYFWTQRSKKEVETTGHRFKQDATPLTRVKFQVPLSMLPDAVLKGMLPRKDQIFKLENNHSAKRSVIKFLPRNSNRGFGGMMVGDWLNPATWQPTSNQMDSEDLTKLYDYAQRYQTKGESSTGNYKENRAFEIKISPNDPIFTNAALIKVTGDTVPKHLRELQKKHRTETLSKLKHMLNRHGAV